ncbi:hypothetical protein F5144DRAFT_574879 [Chaetomium tenue]|uniref:Uncharacterized protein n=1 Tax=Chaetomium tenue TaxID=1854479 RepID=A0ACB7PB43_9PEZI|nr:hypothetical protein F5144DRAFT_574879 [Chaetomium globosum]
MARLLVLFILGGIAVCCWFRSLGSFRRSLPDRGQQLPKSAGRHLRRQADRGWMADLGLARRPKSGGLLGLFNPRIENKSTHRVGFCKLRVV